MNKKKKEKYKRLTDEDLDRWLIETYGEDVVKMLRKYVFPHIEDENFRSRLAKVLIKVAEEEKEKDNKEMMEMIAGLMMGKMPSSWVGAYNLMYGLGKEIVSKVLKELQSIN